MKKSVFLRFEYYAIFLVLLGFTVFALGLFHAYNPHTYYLLGSISVLYGAVIDVGRRVS